MNSECDIEKDANIIDWDSNDSSSPTSGSDDYA